MPSRVVELQEKMAAKQQQVAGIFAAYPDYKMPEEVVTDLRAKNAELGDIAKELEQAREIERMAEETKAREVSLNQPQRTLPLPGGQVGEPAAAKAFRVDRLLTEHKGYQAFQRGEAKTVVFELGAAETKTLLTLSDITPQGDRQAVVPSAQAMRDVSDLMLQGATMSNLIEYYEETTFTNAAAETSEGSSKPEGALDFTLRQDSVRKIPTWIPATTEVLADNAQLQSYIEGRLRFMVRKRREQQLLTGDGIAPNILGILNRSGIQTQAKGGDPTFDAIMKAMTKVRFTGDAEPTGLVMHPNDYQDLVLTRTADGLYILGNPGQAPVDTLWGLQVRVVPAMTENTALVGAFQPYAQIFQREGLTITVSTEHSTYFVENKVAILAEERLALAVYRPAAFCTVTGI